MSSKPRPRTISHDPYAFIEAQAPTPAGRTEEADTPEVVAKAPARGTPAVKITTPFPAELIERARDAAYWDRLTLTGIIVNAVAEALARMEQQRGEPYPPRAGELRGGRPLGASNARKA